MKKRLLSALILLCCAAQLAAAQVMQTQPMSAILHKLKVKGYVAVQEIELKQDEYIAKALDDDGQEVEVHLNAHTGDITGMQKIDPHIPMTDVVESIEQLGYGGITYIRTQNNQFIITALEPGGKPVQLIVDATTGRMLKYPLGADEKNKK